MAQNAAFVNLIKTLLATNCFKMAAPTTDVDDDGFQMVTRKSKKHNKQSRKTIQNYVEKGKIDQSDEFHRNTTDNLTIERRILSAK